MVQQQIEEYRRAMLARGKTDEFTIEEQLRDAAAKEEK